MSQAVVLEVDFNSDQAIQEVSKLRARLAELKEEQKALKKEGKEGSDQFSDNAIQIKLLNTEVRKYEKSIIDQNRILQSNTGSIEQQRATLSVLTAQYNALSEEERENTQTGKDLQASIKATSDELKGLEGSVGNTSRNVGNYQEDIEAAAAGTSIFGNAVPGAVSGLKSLIVSAKAFIATPLGLTLAAIAGILQTVKAAFSDSEEGQNKWNKIVGVSNAILGNFRDLIADAGEFIISIFEDPQEAIKSFGNLIKDNINTRIEGLLGLFPSLGEAIELVFQGEFSKAGKVALDAVGKIALGVDSVTESTEKAVQAVSDFVDQNIKEAAAAADVADARAKADKIERELLVDRAKLEADIAELRLKSREEDRYTAEERRGFLIEARDLQDTLIDREKEVATLRADAIAMENTFARSNKENLDAEAAAKAEISRLEAARLNQARQVQRELTRIDKEIERNAKQAAAEAKKRAEEELKAQETAAKVAAEGIQAEFDRQALSVQERYANGILSREEYEEELQDLNLASLMAQSEALRFYGQDTLKLESSIASERIKIREAEAKQKEQIQKGEAAGFRQSLNQIQGLFEEHTAAYQAIRATQAIIDTYSAANMALSTYPPPLGAIAASLAVVQGLINVDKIREQATKFEDGGLIEIGGRPHSQGGTKFFGEDGTTFEAERGEVLAVVNKRSAPMLKGLSSVNELGGGVSFFKGSRSVLRDGGLVTRAASSQVQERIESRKLQTELADSIERIQIVTKLTDLEKYSDRRAVLTKFSELG
ncbi:hypothetical protein [Croceimicrobium sp.]|uniref:hypothetical protein n=1 Tax=Croceimicrobium sp. TaxID=2828340 RepID=UPI003BAC6836